MELVFMDLFTGELLLVIETQEDRFNTFGTVEGGNPLEYIGEL